MAGWVRVLLAFSVAGSSSRRVQLPRFWERTRRSETRALVREVVDDPFLGRLCVDRNRVLSVEPSRVGSKWIFTARAELGRPDSCRPAEFCYSLYSRTRTNKDSFGGWNLLCRFR